MRESEAKFRRQFRYFPIPAYIWKKDISDFILIDSNRAAEIITEGTIGEHYNTRASDLYRDNPQILEDLMNCYEETSNFQREMAYEDKKIQKTFYLRFQYSHVPPDCVVVYTEDITERRKVDEQIKLMMKELTRSNKELEQFASVTSHDLKEPLRMITSYLQLLSLRYKGEIDSQADTFIDYAVKGAQWMDSMINDLLMYSRVSTSTKKATPIDLERILVRVLNNVQVAIKESDASITHDQLPTVKADEAQMVQLLQNLIGNAIKFRGEKPPKIHVEVERKENDWCFLVRDNGIGFEQQYAERIFQVFKRLHTKDEYPGTGIGLPICRKIVEQHDGRIWAESEPGKGSIFYFTLPITN